MNYSKNVLKSLTMISQFGINMLVPIFLCSFAGMYLDEKLGTSYFMVILFFVGALAGFRNVFVFARRIYTKTDKVRKGHRSEKDAETTKGNQ